MTERLLTVPAVAELLALSPYTVWRLVLDGRLASHKIGRSRRIAESDVQNMLAQSREVGGKAMGRGVPSARGAGAGRHRTRE